MGLIFGVDGCRAGWFVVSRDPVTGEVAWQVCRNAVDFAFQQPELAVIAIDIPIGLTDQGPRACDQQARKLLGRGRASSVFSAPIRPVMAASSYHEACEIRTAIDGRKMSKQAWFILPKIREVDDLLRKNAGLQPRIRESHPELCFTYLADGQPMQFGKKKPEGFAERLPLLETQFGSSVRSALAARKPAQCAPDDVLDAFALLWTAERITRGKAVSLPEEPQRDRYGLRMEIVV